jgi:flagellum-specific ATP synthase
MSQELAKLGPLSRAPIEDLRAVVAPKVDGRVTDLVGLLIEAYCPGSSVGDLVRIESPRQAEPITAEVIGLRDSKLLMIALDDVRGISMGSRVSALGCAASVACSASMLGRVLDARGLPIDVDAGPLLGPFEHRPLYASAPSPLSRRLIKEPFLVGVRAIDSLLTLGRGQRIGVMAGAGVGKSTLMGAMTQHAQADVNVVALIGERGREVQEFLHQALPAASRAKTVLLAVTSDRSPLERMRGAFAATAIAEYFAGQGKSVLFMMDSLTRFAMAQRELGLSMGEPPATRGYTPSVFSQLPRLLERCGAFGRGSITGVYTVLVEGDDMNDPISDSARSILDGHIVLSRDLAARGHFPAIDVLPSISRVMDQVTPNEHKSVARLFRRLLAQIKEAEELVQIGAYTPGADETLDRALHRKKAVMEFLRQSPGEVFALDRCVKVMTQLVEGVT